MRILIDGYNLSKQKGTGVANYGKNLAQNLLEAGHEVGIIFPYNIKNINRNKNLTSLVGDIKINLKEFESIKFYKMPIYFLQACLQQYKVREISLNKEAVIPEFNTENFYRYRILYGDSIFKLAHAFFQLTNQLLPIKVPDDVDIVHWTYPIPIRALNKPNLYTIHDLVPIRLPYTTLDNKELYVKTIAKICQNAHKIVTVSDHTKEDLCQLFEIEKNKVFTSWQSSFLKKENICSQFMQDSILQTYNLRKQDYFIFLGNIEPKKNVKRLIQGYLSSNAEQPLIIIGDKAWKSEEELAQYYQLKKTIELSNQLNAKLNQIRILKYLPQQEMVALLANAKALIFPSLYEGFGLPVLEAMQLGVPVLTSNTSSIPEIAGDAALYIDPYDVEAISLGINKLSNENQLCQQLSKKGFERSRKFNTTLYQKRIIELYNSIINQ